MSAEASTGTTGNQPWWKTDYAVIGFFALLKVLINGSVITRYGFQRDELYFIACGRHLSYGYVDHTPMVPWIARLTQTLFGESLLALRLPSLAAGALSVILAGLLVREMGGKRWAQAFVCAVMIATPAYLRAHSILHIPTFEMVYWTACFLVLARIINTGNGKLWVLFGAIAGVGILNKPTVLFLGTGTAVALVFTPLRKHLLRPWVYAGGAIVLLIFLPNLIWQYHHDWATYHFVKQLNKETMQDISFLDFMLGQGLYMGPLNILIWVPGLFFLLFSKRGAQYRALGLICVTVYAVLVIAKAKVYYLAPAYPALYAGGVLAWQRIAEILKSTVYFLATKYPMRFGWGVPMWQRIADKRAWLQGAAFALPVIGLVWMAPLGLPMLDIEKAPGAIRSMTGGLVDENTAHEITGDWYDQFGWENMVATIAKVYKSLGPEEQRNCIILTRNYGQASAIGFFGRKYGLPDALCTYMTYYYWGPGDRPGDRPGDIAITVGLRPENIALYAEVSLAATITGEKANKFENNVPVLICRKPTKSIQEAWKTIKRAGF